MRSATIAKRFNWQNSVKQFHQIMDLFKFNIGFLQTRFDVFLDTLLSEETCGITVRAITRPKFPLR